MEHNTLCWILVNGIYFIVILVYSKLCGRIKIKGIEIERGATLAQANTEE